MLRIWLASGDELSPVSGKKFHVPPVKLHLRTQHNFPICLQRLRSDGVAARKGHTEVARLLVDAGADKNALDERDGMSAVSHAASAGYAEIVRLLVDAVLSAGKLLHMQFVKATLRLPDFC